ncbi:MAG TPA: cupin domain-containing protein [Anaerovoracaceae bacterium]|nr:cupin domain-containing protein [Anaerovoracaceae bacterium]
MVRKSKIEIKTNTAGEKDAVIFESANTQEELLNKCSLFGRMTLKPGCRVGYHLHEGNIESYYILSGKGVYTCEGVKTEVESGDMAYCGNGQSHDLINSGDEDLVVMALIVLDK